MFGYLTLAERIPVAPASGFPPARRIRVLADRSLERMDAEFEQFYSSTGRPSIAPERVAAATIRRRRRTRRFRAIRTRRA
jgi:transposase